MLREKGIAFMTNVINLNGVFVREFEIDSLATFLAILCNLCHVCLIILRLIGFCVTL